MTPTRYFGFAEVLCIVCTWHTLFQCTEATVHAKDCAEVRPWIDGAYVIYPEGFQPFGVLCKFDDDGIWTLLQNNVGGMDWTRGWSYYRNGFGWMAFDKSFWLGLEKMHWLTAKQPERHYVLRVDVIHDDGTDMYADFDSFSISDETNGYYISYGDYLGGTAGDGLRGYHRNKMFSTTDRDNDGSIDRHCADLYLGGWWYDDCGFSGLNRGNLYWNETSSTYSRSTMRIRAHHENDHGNNGDDQDDDDDNDDD